MRLIFILVSALFLATASDLLAYSATTHTLSVPYDIVPISIEEPAQQYFLGELEDFPEMYEVVFEATSTLTLAIRAVPQEDEQIPLFSGIVIRDKAIRGVEEVARLKAGEASWLAERDPLSGLEYFTGGKFQAEVPPGTYRIEVSTPNNAGKYILVFGDDNESAPYGVTLASIAATYEFYDVSKIGMIRSPLLLYPAGIMMILILFAATWYWQKRRIIHA